MKTLYSLLLAASASLPFPALADTFHIYICRHAEKAASDSKDPPLTAEGERRAQHIATMLKDAGLRQVFSTKYERTRQTAAPAAAQFGLQVQIYDPAAQEAFARRLRGHGGNALVVGHSNTVPALVRQLGGSADGEIPETEYSRLYRLTFTDDGQVATTVLNSQP